MIEASQNPDVQAFEGVPDALAQTLSRRGFTELTVVQRAALAPELEGRDLRISSQTGSGKTVAIGLVLGKALLGRADEARVRTSGAAKPIALIVAPTRELAAQIGKELEWLFAELRVRVAVVTGGTSMGGDFRTLKASPEVLVGTPGRLVDHLTRGSLDLSAASTVVLDEADEMLDMGFREDLEAILERTPEGRATHLVSATFAHEVLALADRYQREPARVEGAHVGRANQDIEHVAYLVRAEDRGPALVNLLLANPSERTLVFVRTRADATEVAEQLGYRGFAARCLSGELGQNERTATLDAFRAGTTQILVATDVASRGLDVQGVMRVVHYDLPGSAEAFTHRSGRTGRAGQRGESVLFVTPASRLKAERLLALARVKVERRHLPTKAEIEARADARVKGELAALALPEGKEDRLRAMAGELLAERDPVELVAALLGRGAVDSPCAPFEIRPIDVHGGKAPRERGVARGVPSGPTDGSWVLFHVSWGARHGADPRRLLALVCRRGGITRKDVGAIRVSDHSSVIEVAASAADGFHTAIRRPDRRDANVKIRPFEASPPARAERRPRREAPIHGRPRRELERRAANG
jgi:ATP-dependent RNA helicase DeaD